MYFWQAIAMNNIRFSHSSTATLTVGIIEILSEATGVSAALIKAATSLHDDLRLSGDAIDELRTSAEFEFGFAIDADGWLQNADCVGSIAEFLFNSQPSSTPTSIQAGALAA